MTRRATLTRASEDRAVGCLLGQLAGDSLGSLVEFRREADIVRQYGPSGPTDLADGGTWNTLAGQPTDDSELAILLARSVVFAGRPDPAVAFTSYRWWYSGGFSRQRYTTMRVEPGFTEVRVRTYDDPDDLVLHYDGPDDQGAYRVHGSSDSWGPGAVAYGRRGMLSRPFDVGGQTSVSLSGARPAGNGRIYGKVSEANGSLMRCSPIGIWGAGRESKLVAAAARRDSALTHPSQVCRDACAVLTVAIARAITTGPSDPHAFYRRLLDYFEPRYDTHVYAVLVDAARRPPTDYSAHKGHVLIALQNAFYQLLHAPTLELGVTDTVRRGGDTDTNAAICGALLGAFHGRYSIPKQWETAISACRPDLRPGVAHPRPRVLWPTDVIDLALRVLYTDGTKKKKFTVGGTS